MEGVDVRVEHAFAHIYHYLGEEIALLFKEIVHCVRILLNSTNETPENVGKALLVVAETEGLISHTTGESTYVISRILNHMFDVDPGSMVRSMVIGASLWAEDENKNRLDICVTMCSCSHPKPLWQAIYDDLIPTSR
jgi:hypothetical protein